MSAGHPQFGPIWPNTKAIRIGYLSGRGYTAPAIAADLDDGTLAGTIRVQLQRSGIKRSAGETLPVHLSNHELRRLAQLAGELGIDPTEWVQKIVIAAVRDDLFRAIVDE